MPSMTRSLRENTPRKAADVRWTAGVLMVAAVLSAASARLARAQAWVPPAGSGTITLANQVIDNTGHLLTDGSLLPDGKSRDASVYVEAEYALNDRLSIAAGLPFVFARYIGPRAAPGPPQEVDVCRCWHGAWQDFGVTARYGVVNGPLAITPSIAVGVPSHGYAYRGESVVGRHLRELRLGISAGRRLDAVSPRLSLQGTYTYAVVERVADIPNNRSNATLDGAYAATRRMSVRGFGAWQRTHGGLRAGVAPPPAEGYPWGEIVSAELFTQHDRLLRDNSFHAGAGAAYAFPSFDLFGSYIAYVSGTDSHAGRVFTTGISVPFEIHRKR
jgi:hypothetical protein